MRESYLSLVECGVCCSIDAEAKVVLLTEIKANIIMLSPLLQIRNYVAFNNSKTSYISVT